MSGLPTRALLFPAGATLPADAKTYFAQIYDFVAQRFAPGMAGVTAATAAEIQAARNGISASSSGFRNVIIGGDHSIDNNGGAAVTVVAGAALAPATEMFFMACTGANVTFQQVTGADGRKRTRFTGAAGNTGVIFSTCIEAKNSMELAGIVATLSEKISSTSLTSIAWAAFYANTADAFGTLAAPTRASIASGSITINSAETVFSNQITMPSAATTGIEIVFTAGALLASQTLTFGDNQLEPGAISTPAIVFEKVDVSTQLTRTQRYFESSFYGTTVTDGVGVGGGVANTTSRMTCGMKWLAQKRIAPVVTAFNPGSGAGASVANPGVNSVGISGSATSINGIGYIDSGGGFTIGQGYVFHYTANARMH